LAALDAALDAWDGVDMADVRAKSVALTELFAARVTATCARLGAEVAFAVPPERRGSQVSVRHAQGYAVVQALIARGVVGDFRMPDLMRFGFAPLYTRYVDAWDAAEVLYDLLATGAWDRPEFHARASVT
jgi:kynureninase